MKKQYIVAGLLLLLCCSLVFAAGDFNKPTTTSTYTNYSTEIRDMFADQAKLFSGTSTTNYPTNAIRYNASTKRLEKYNGSTWDKLDVSGIDSLTTLEIGTFSAVTSTATVTNLSAHMTDGYHISSSPTTSTGIATDGSGNMRLGTVPLIYPGTHHANYYELGPVYEGAVAKVGVFGGSSSWQLSANVGRDAAADATHATTGPASMLAMEYNSGFPQVLTKTTNTAGEKITSWTTNRAVVLTDDYATTKLVVKVINIGDWNMNTTQNIAVTHGVTLSKVRSVTALIRNDADTVYSDLNSRSAPAGETYGNGIQLNSTTVTLNRTTGGYFNNTSYQATSYNRGWITITYTE